MSKSSIIVDGVCPFCATVVAVPLAEHIQQAHGADALKRAVLADKQRGLSDPFIGAKYGISFRYLERVITEAIGANVSVLARPKRITHYQPKDFHLETTTVWSFKQRGNWATHDGRYRGNWSPYIPRNLILRYSQPNELVLDPFVGGGTTAVEAKLLGRRCIARDINPDAVALTKENLNFDLPMSLFNRATVYEPEVAVGDARDLSGIADNSVDFICAHPPYAGIISYSATVDGDLSQLSHSKYLEGISAVASECYRVLKRGRQCAVLIGDTRQKKQVVPMGFQVIRLFLDAGFHLKELIIKRQHHCKTTGFWYTNSIKFNFLLLAHEYLPVFEKPSLSAVAEARSSWRVPLSQRTLIERVRQVECEKLETTTVWLFPPNRMDAEIRRNLLARFATQPTSIAEIQLGDAHDGADNSELPSGALALVHFPNDLKAWRGQDVSRYISTVRHLADNIAAMSPTTTFVIEAQDVRVNGYVQPLGLLAYEALKEHPMLRLREIVVVAPDEVEEKRTAENELTIVHRYLLIFTRRASI
ncbi:MAG: DNA methyltransferase [Abditibacteriales bacterium]|nr:DNA methyltransferase [Abditibacteriales bacterium]